MKSKYLIVLFLAFFFSCKNDGIKKPSKLIKEETMIDILYDINILDAIISSNPGVIQDNNIDSQDYIYKKYAIDSLQFAENAAYYASDLKRYKKMYETVENRMEENKKLADSLLKMKQKADEKKAEELKSLNKDSIKKPRNMKEASDLLKN